MSFKDFSTDFEKFTKEAKGYSDIYKNPFGSLGSLAGKEFAKTGLGAKLASTGLPGFMGSLGTLAGIWTALTPKARGFNEIYSSLGTSYKPQFIKPTIPQNKIAYSLLDLLKRG